MKKKYNFDKWRKKYDSYSFEQQKEIHNKFERLWPKQQHFNVKAVVRFLNSIREDKKIMEIGGWKGELGCEMIKRRDIIYWHNFEICENAVKKTVCNNILYTPILLEHFPWEYTFLDYNVCIFSHVVEHIRARELEKLFSQMKDVKYIYIHAPIKNEPISWKGINSSHILEVGWNGIKEMLKNYKEEIYTNQIRVYKK